MGRLNLTQQVGLRSLVQDLWLPSV